MKLQKHIYIVFIATNLFGQTNSGLYPKMSFGLNHSANLSMCFNSLNLKPNIHRENQISQTKTKLTETQFGFGIGLFMWMPLNEGIVFKPKIEGVFSNTCLKQSPSVFATSFDLNISHGFVISLKKPNENGIIYLARNMSCYLTSKQPYLLIGPNINLKKYDNGYLNEGFENEFLFGFVLGYGINYIFQGKNFAPEICYTISSNSQNQINDSKKTTHTISVSLNFF
jgi:tetrahydromethanopterin S-methyltransferase subunit B